MLTSKHQIDRLLRAGSTYFNLNPFEVLQIDDETTPVEDIKKKYKRLSILCHPDKNQDDQDRAQTAFEIINRAWKILENVRRLKASESISLKMFILGRHSEEMLGRLPRSQGENRSAARREAQKAEEGGSRHRHSRRRPRDVQASKICSGHEAVC